MNCIGKLRVYFSRAKACKGIVYFKYDLDMCTERELSLIIFLPMSYVTVFNLNSIIDVI